LFYCLPLSLRYDTLPYSEEACAIGAPIFSSKSKFCIIRAVTKRQDFWGL